MWHALAPFVPALTQEEARIATAALEASAGHDAITGVRELRHRAAHHGLADIAAVLEERLGRTDARQTR
jgi:hypothetical protein